MRKTEDMTIQEREHIYDLFALVASFLPLLIAGVFYMWGGKVSLIGFFMGFLCAQLNLRVAGYAAKRYLP